MITIGLIGGIGSGKSTIASMLEEQGAVLINADLVGHAVYEPGTPAWQDVQDTFGPDVLSDDRTVNRRRLGEIVFNNPEALQKLNAIVHPRMYRIIEEQLAQLRSQGTKVAVLEAAILLEAHWEPLVDQIWCTVASEEEVIRRLAGRFTAEQVRGRMAAQMPQEERARRSHMVIDTERSLEELREKVGILWPQLTAHPEAVPQL